MRLRIRIENGSADRLAQLQAMCERAIGSINPIPIPDLEVVYGVSYLAANAVARMIPEPLPAQQNLIISEGLLDAPPERQELTILHELLHLSLTHGVLAQRWEREVRLRQQYPHPHDGLTTGDAADKVHHAVNRYFTAFYFFLLPDEILAERALREGYADRLPERLRQHIDMRTANLGRNAHADAHPALRKYWLALEYQRADMMIALSDAGPERTQLETIVATYRDMLVAEAGEPEAHRLIALVDRINRYQVGDADSEAACDEAFEEIMGLVYAEPITAA
jgi:hypothetical protein